MTSPQIEYSDGRRLPKRSRSISKSLLRWTRTLHIYFSTFALLMVLFFATTGFIMNHSEWFGVDKQTITESKEKIPDEILKAGPAGSPSDLKVVEYLRSKLGARGEADASGINDDPIRVSFKGPHYSFDIAIDKASDEATVTKTTDSFSGWITNLHKGADTGNAWHRIIDCTSIVLAFISLTGLILWLSLSKRRMVGIVSIALGIIIVVGVFVLMVP